MRKLVEYFAQRKFTANVIMFGLILISFSMWDIIGKEERPEFAMNWVRVAVPYPGASAKDVELFVIKPIEEQLKGVSGLYEIYGTARFARASFRITTDPDITREEFKEKVQEIKDAVERADLPSEIEDPVYDQFNSSEKAIIDIALYLDGVELLDVESRKKLQEFALTFKNRILSLPEVSGVEARAYLKPEIQIEVDPEKLLNYEISMSEVAEQIQKQHLRTPLGAMEDKAESEVALRSYMDNVDSLKKAIISSNFQNTHIKLSEIADVKWGFEKTTSIRKIQGHEAVVFNIQKSRGYGILKAREAVFKLVERFEKDFEGSNVKVKLLDDESYDIRNRLAIISTNGLAGFLIILLVLFVFLDSRSGFWVAMGLPFSLAFTLIGCLLAGYTVNNITLAAIIIVLGIVVDDAIIVADNISKHRRRGDSPLKSAIDGTMEVIQPVLAGVLTTCVAFIPLLFFEGRFGLFVKFIPLVVILMLGASLLESFFILPAHMVEPKVSKTKAILAPIHNYRKKMMDGLENVYRKILNFTLKYRSVCILFFAAFLGFGYWIFSSQLKFVMFPREQTKEFAVKIIGQENATRSEMAKHVRKFENLLINDKFSAVVGFRTVIGESRRGGEVRENEASLRVELLPPDEQPVDMQVMLDFWESEAKKIKEFQDVRILKSWWSSSSGSPIAIEVLENNDKRRKLVTEKLAASLGKLSDLKNVEIEKPRVKKEYGLDLNLEETMRLGIDPAQMARTMRSFIQGRILYRLYEDEEIDVRLTSKAASKDKIEQVLDLRASNSQGYLVPMKQLVHLQEQRKPSNIQRVNFKRADYVYADLNENPKMTPLEIASYLEEQVFPEILKESPSTLFNFRGEIEDSRDSGSDFFYAILLTVFFIYIILVFMFSSLSMPTIIIAAIPFGAAGVAMAFWGHGMDRYGFFAVIGAIGMLGVVINDSIVMLDRFEEGLKNLGPTDDWLEKVKELAITRLRPVILTTLTTVAGVFPTAYGIGGYDATLADMMLAMGWGLIFGTFITLVFMPIVYSFLFSIRSKVREVS